VPGKGSLDHLIGPDGDARGDREAEGPGGLEVHNQTESRWLPHR